MKKYIFLVMIAFIMITIQISYATEVHVSVTLNESYILEDNDSLLINDTTFLMARPLVELLNEDIKWDNENRQVIIEKEEEVLVFDVDDQLVTLNNEILAMEKKPFIRSGRTYIPLRLVAEFLGCDVSWDQETFTVHLLKEGIELTAENTYIPDYTKEDLFWLSKIVQVESSDGPLEMKLAIANVVLNRVKDPRFPSTVYDVIFQIDQYVQFPPAHWESFPTIQPTLKSQIASKNALEGVNNIGYSLYFNNSPFKSKSDDLYKIIHGEYFYE